MLHPLIPHRANLIVACEAPCRPIQCRLNTPPQPTALTQARKRVDGFRWPRKAARMTRANAAFAVPPCHLARLAFCGDEVVHLPEWEARVGVASADDLPVQQEDTITLFDPAVVAAIPIRAVHDLRQVTGMWACGDSALRS